MNNDKPSIMERISKLMGQAREGIPVDTAELASLLAQQHADKIIREHKEAGDAERAREAAERERLARRATAVAEARDELPALRDQLHTAYDALAAALAQVTAIHDTYADRARHHATTLAEHGFAAIDQYAREEYELRAAPNYDRRIVPNLTNGSVKIDGVRYAATSPAHGILWAVYQAGHGPELDAWRRSRDTHPLTPPLPELADGEAQ